MAPTLSATPTLSRPSSYQRTGSPRSNIVDAALRVAAARVELRFGQRGVRNADGLCSRGRQVTRKHRVASSRDSKIPLEFLSRRKLRAKAPRSTRKSRKTNRNREGSVRFNPISPNHGEISSYLETARFGDACEEWEASGLKGKNFCAEFVIFDPNPA